MPELRDALDHERYAELVNNADLGVNLWSSLKLACERGDNAVIKLNCQQIQILTRTVFALAKRIGSAEGDNG